MGNLRPVLIMALVFLGYMIWIEWQKDYGPQPRQEPSVQQSTPALDGVPDVPDFSSASSSAAPDLPSVSIEPETRETSTGPAATAAGAHNDLISRDPETGKFYVHPGDSDTPVLLGGDPVTAPTELRKGDRIGVGGAEFEFLA